MNANKLRASAACAAIGRAGRRRPGATTVSHIPARHPKRSARYRGGDFTGPAHGTVRPDLPEAPHAPVLRHGTVPPVRRGAFMGAALDRLATYGQGAYGDGGSRTTARGHAAMTSA